MFRLEQRIAAELKREGMRVGGHASLQDVTAELLAPYHVVVFYQHRMVPALTPTVRRSLDALRAFVREGGGLLVTKDLYSRRGATLYRALLSPMGAGVLHEQVVEGDPSMVRQLSTLTAPAGRFAWTDAIARGHPATRGVTGLFYNIGRWEPGEPGSLPVKVDSAWTVLVSGRPSASTRVSRPTGFDPVKDNRGPGSFTRSPPLLAARPLGKGRVALWPTLASFTLLDGYSPVLEGGLVMRPGQRGAKPSHGARLTYNLLRWLAGDAPAPGPSPPLLTARFKPVPAVKRRPGKRRPRVRSPGVAHRGLIGAYSRHSGGRADPGQLIAAARKAGYKFIAFAENLDRLSPHSWDQLKRTCAAASGQGFAAIPGLRYRGADGDSFIALGPIPYPPAAWADPRTPGKKILHNGTLRMALEPVPPMIMLPFPHNHRPARLHSSFYGFALQVWEHGKLQVADQATYLQLQREGLSLFATAVHLVDTPAGVRAAATRGMQAWVRASSPAGVLAAIQGLNKARGRYFKAGFASAGPEVVTLNAANWGTTDLARTGRERIRVRLHVRAPAGLREVQLLDGGALYRRFLPGGARELSETVDALHDRQHSFVLVATDRRGRRAVSWSRHTNVQELSFGMAGDNMNDLGPLGKVLLDRGKVRLRGTEHSVTLVPGPGSTIRFPALVATDLTGKRARPPGRHAAMRRSHLVSRFGAEISHDLDHFWDGPGLPGGAYAATLAPNPLYTGTMRQTILARLPPGPDLVVREFHIVLKQQVILAQTPGVVLFTSSNRKLAPGALDHLVLPDGQGGYRDVRPTGARARFTAAVQPGQYAAIYPTVTAAYPLDRAMHALVVRDPRPGGKASTLLQLGVGRRGETLAAGTEIRARIALLTLPLAARGEYSWLPRYRSYQRSRELADEVAARLGISGPPAYLVKATAGEITGTQLMLGIRAHGGGFSGRFGRAALALPLPVRISGLNPRWSAGLWYRGDNRILRTEWPPGWHRGNPRHHRYVQLRALRDPYYPVGVDFLGNGLLQVDLHDGDRDLFVGHPVVCDNPDLRVLFIPGVGLETATVKVHNPTDRAVATTLRPGKGFDRFRDFAHKVKVDSGKTVKVRLRQVVH